MKLYNNHPLNSLIEEKIRYLKKLINRSTLRKVTILPISNISHVVDLVFAYLPITLAEEVR
jgi:hypothetical protein